MVAAETHEAGQRIIQHLPCRAGPDGCAHRQQVPGGEGVGISAGLEEVAQRAVGVGMRVQPGHALAVEAQDVGQHAPELRAPQVAPLSKDGCQAAARPLEVRLVETDRERHVGRHASDAEMLEQRGEIGIGMVVEDQETGVDRMGDAFQRHVDRIGVPAEVVARLVQGHIVPRGEQPGAGQPGNACAHHGDAPARTLIHGGQPCRRWWDGSCSLQ